MTIHKMYDMSLARTIAYRLEEFSLRKKKSAAFSLQRCSCDYLFETGNCFGLDQYLVGSVQDKCSV